MRECQHCAEHNQASARFCVGCGAPLSSAEGGGLLPPPPLSVPRPSKPAPSEPALSAPAPPAIVMPAVPAQATAQPPASQALAAVQSAARRLGDDLPLDGPRTLVGFLVSYENVEVGQYWPIHQGRNVLGRLDAATGLDIEIAHPTTSSLHAVLLAGSQPGRVVIEDTNSTNGTYVNDNVLSSGQRWELRDGDCVRFGLFNTIIKVIQP